MAVNVTVDVPDLRRLAQDIRRADKEAASQLRKEFRRIGKKILHDARDNARSNLPSRLAGRGAMALDLSVNNDRASIVMRKSGPSRNGRRQPGQITRLFEIGSQRNRGYIKHPAWPRPGTTPDQWTWLPTSGRQPIKPSVQPALDANREWAARELQQAIETAMKKAHIWGSVKFRA